MSTGKRRGFLGGAAILAGAVAITKLIGAVYKIPLGNLLGKEGMGPFQAAYNVYSVLLTVSTAGLPLALSRLVAETCDAIVSIPIGAATESLNAGIAASITLYEVAKLRASRFSTSRVVARRS